MLHVSRSKEENAKFTPEQQAAIGEYASLHGNQVAIRRVSKQLGEAAQAKFKNMKFYSKGNSVIYEKICTYQNFPLYGMQVCRELQKEIIHRERNSCSRTVYSLGFTLYFIFTCTNFHSKHIARLCTLLPSSWPWSEIRTTFLLTQCSTFP